MAFLDPVLNPILQPLLNMSPFWGIFLLALVISLIITVVYKLVTNQNEMKRLKEEQKGYQKRMKELKSKPDEMMKVQKEAMKHNMEYMKHSFKPTLITMLPILLIFGWMNAHLMYEPIYPGEPFSVTAIFEEGLSGEAEMIVDEKTELISEAKQNINSDTTWRLKSSEGEHFLTVKVGKEEQTKKVMITKELKYEEMITKYEHSGISEMRINYNKLKPLGPGFNIFGWYPGWLGVYIVLSLIFSIGLRKALKVY